MSDNKEISDTIRAANTYLSHLKSLHNKIQNAEEQIRATSAETEKIIDTTFSNLQTNLVDVLHSRRDDLIKRVQSMKGQSLVPFEECRTDISNKIEKTYGLINEGNLLLKGLATSLDEFNEKSSSLGSLPEIPDLKEVPYISFQHEPSIVLELLDNCSRLGDVSRIAPVQINQMCQRPGAILVEWISVDNDDRCVDIQEFRLQKAFGDVLIAKHLTTNFSDCFLGLETQFLVKELQPNQPYSFRVCCKFEGSNEWSPWSLPQVTQTTIKPFAWRNNRDFILADNNKIATPVKDLPSVLISDGPQIAAGYSVEFTYLEFDEKSSAIIGLIVGSDREQITDIKKQNLNFFTVDSTGEICVDGVVKATKLPKVTKGLKLCFACEPTYDNKVRVNIDSCDKRVTYDWPIRKHSKIYFAAQLQSPANKIMVE